MFSIWHSPGRRPPAGRAVLGYSPLAVLYSRPEAPAYRLPATAPNPLAEHAWLSLPVALFELRRTSRSRHGTRHPTSCAIDPDPLSG